LTTETAVRRVAIYVRVSSEDQAERGTIRTQVAEIRRRLEQEAGVVVVDEYADDGVSGTVLLSARPSGARLLAEARVGRFSEVWVYRLDRLGRDLVGLALARRDLVGLGIRLVSALEGEPDEFMFDIQSAVAANERRVFLRRSADGMARAARDGRYCGGIVPFGYRVEGRQQSARLVLDDSIVWADLSAAALVRWTYERLGLDGWSCRRIATDLNARGVPTHYERDGRGVRGKRTQGLWRAGRIRNLVVNPVYRGELCYGRRSTKKGEVIAAPIEALVSAALWHAAQDTLAANRTIAKNTRRHYLLRGAIRCGICGLSYCGSQGRGEVGWYRCTGQLVERGPIVGRCWGQSIRTDAIEPLIWADIERWLRDPGDILDDLDGRAERGAQGAIAAAESITLARALEALDGQRRQVLALNIRGRLADLELDAELDRIAVEKTALERRVAAPEPAESLVVPEAAIDLLDELRARLDAGLTNEERQEIVRLLVRVVVQTETAAERRKKTARVLVEYRFPGVVEAFTGRGSSPQRAETGRGIASPGPPGRSRRSRPRVAAAMLRGRPARTRAARRGTARRDQSAFANVTRDGRKGGRPSPIRPSQRARLQ
jgi:site-specific DNA recombinase